MLWYADRERALDQGTVLFFHGLGASKDVQAKELESLAARGFFVVGVDNVGHGERHFPDFDMRFSPDNPNIEFEFVLAVRDTAREVPALVDWLEREGLIREGRLGIGGISMGAMISYTAIVLEPRIRAAALMVGSPKWKIDLADSPHRAPERFRDVALLSLTGGADTIVPPQDARAFHDVLNRRFPDRRDRHVYVEYPESDHMMREEDWNVAWGQVLAWFERFLV